MKYDYDLIVIGGGAAGLVAATGAALLGACTALIEKNKLGGDCTWYGCVPSKALLKSAQVFSALKRLKEFGISSSGNCAYRVDGVMAHVREIVKEISTHHPVQLFEQRGIKVLFGNPCFADRNSLELNGDRLSAKRFVICTGSHPLLPPIEGLNDINYLTNENIFDLETLPKSLAVLGGGPIGIEIAQALGRLGVEVVIVEMLERILFREDAEVAALLHDALAEEDIKIYTGQKAVRLSQEGDLIALTLEDKDRKQSLIKVQKILIAVGRAPNLKGLGLEKAQVQYTKQGIQTDATLRTSTANIYACGDVVGPYQFSHLAEYQAIIAVANALFPFKRKVDYSAVSWCTFTEPELAHLGLTEDQARATHKDVRVYRCQYRESDRAITDLKERGLAKVICDRRGRILGAHIVGANAGELISEYVLAKSAKLKINKLSQAIHIYPTFSQIVKKSADRYYTALFSASWFKKFSRFFIARMK